MINRSKLYLFLVPLILFLTSFGLSSQEQKTPANTTSNEECAACHEEIVLQFATSAHGKAFRYDSEYASATCESCHGSAKAHIESGDPADILHPLKATQEKGNQVCLSCHENGEEQAHWKASAHEAAGLKCAQCHSMHSNHFSNDGATNNDNSKYKDWNDLCVSCHTGLQISMSQRSRHPFREGKIDCVSCHNPHGSMQDHQLRGDSVNDLCFSCHQEKRGPFLWEHSPVREDCMTCHTPHGSNHEKLLVARTNQLCQSCHLQGRHQTVAGLPTAMWNVNRMCTNCHPQIHGSNHPSGPLFQR